ncbi:MFS transporter [Kitasatospora sp. DSM 101779]|uniref:MFS transporter n=1 Tax=Kitasatospora sp. DSM 101779 TaxID=2853165 RepID=UPI0021D8F5B6|nr:MFS transporter [Kitasatospora sp. DSM 101779]MCU7825911.1 MFS transporter [Kitasatospora sp. DSM 101779]
MAATAITPTSTGAPAPRTAPGFALLGTVQATLIFTLMAISVPLPDIGREFGLDHSRLVLLNAAYGLSFAALLLLGGRLTDRYGGRRMLTTGLVVLGLASIAAPAAPGYTALLLLRFLQGAAAALVAPAGMAVLRTLLPGPAAYGRAMATWGGLSVLGATTGNLASGAVASWLSWRWMFAVPVVVAAGALALAPALLPRDPARDRRPALDLPGAVLATAGTVLVSYGLVLTETGGWQLPLTLGLLVLVAFVLRERRAAQPLLPLGFLRGGRRLLGLAATLLSAGGTATLFLLLTLHLQQDLGWTPLATSGAFLPYAAALLLGGRAAGPLVGRIGPKAVTGIGLATGAAGLFALAHLGAGSGYLPLVPGLVLLPFGAALAFAGAAVLATDGVPEEQIGLAGGVLNTAMELGPTVLLTALLTVGSSGAALAAAGVLFALTALAGTLTGRRG